MKNRDNCENMNCGHKLKDVDFLQLGNILKICEQATRQCSLFERKYGLFIIFLITICKEMS